MVLNIWRKTNLKSSQNFNFFDVWLILDIFPRSRFVLTVWSLSASCWKIDLKPLFKTGFPNILDHLYEKHLRLSRMGHSNQKLFYNNRSGTVFKVLWNCPKIVLNPTKRLWTFFILFVFSSTKVTFRFSLGPLLTNLFWSVGIFC